MGHIWDGTGQYTHNQNCEWIIAPTGASQVVLVFDELGMENWYDFVHVDSCDDTACTNPDNLGSFTGSSVPRNPVVSSTGIMRVRMETDYSVAAEGFKATFATEVSECQPDHQVLVGQGIIREGQGRYSNNLACSLDLVPSESSESMTLTFVDWQMESGYDYVSVSECSGPAGAGTRASQAVQPASGSKLRAKQLEAGPSAETQLSAQRGEVIKARNAGLAKRSEGQSFLGSLAKLWQKLTSSL